MNVQFCCGGNKLDGWENHDSEVEICGTLPYANDSVDFILIEHGLEHVNCACGFLFLRECHRILRPDGVLRVCVPKALQVPDNAHKIDLIVGHGHQMIYDYPVLADMMYLAGFKRAVETLRKDCDQHWKTIGMDKDSVETLRMEATK